MTGARERAARDDSRPYDGGGSFLQMPRFLCSGELAGGGMSNNARVLYTLLLDRYKVSIKNDWRDDCGEVYIYFGREEMERMLGVSKNSVYRAMKELKELLLVKEIRQGLCKPNRLYILQSGQMCPSVGVNTAAPKRPYLPPNYNNYNKNKPNNNKMSMQPNKNVSNDPFLERALMAYAKCTDTEQ